MALLGMLGAVGWLLSDASTPLACVGAAAWLAGGGLLARRELAQPRQMLVAHPGGAAARDGHPVDDLAIDWRGPFIMLAWRESGRAVRRLVFPDVLSAAQRRELRLWSLRRREHARPAAVAP